MYKSKAGLVTTLNPLLFWLCLCTNAYCRKTLRFWASCSRREITSNRRLWGRENSRYLLLWGRSLYLQNPRFISGWNADRHAFDAKRFVLLAHFALKIQDGKWLHNFSQVSKACSIVCIPPWIFNWSSVLQLPKFTFFGGIRVLESHIFWKTCTQAKVFAVYRG